MKELPWFVFPAVIILIYFMVKLYRIMLRLICSEPEKHLPLHDLGDWHQREIEAYIKNQGSILEQKIKLVKEIAGIKKAMQPEIQCQGCGYFHNVRRCPKCTRMVNEKTSWVTSGRTVSDCSHDTIYHVPPYKYIPAINILKVI